MIEQQVNILISKNQALQIIYLKHHDNVYKTSSIVMDKKPWKFYEQTYPTVQTETDNNINHRHTL